MALSWLRYEERGVYEEIGRQFVSHVGDMGRDKGWDP